ncbi:MAG TPA: ABC transporter ATP-binding protein [Bacteroidota bacterium]|nr:ABC transporter ATP-binding protein [Bacteroidota bacterium]
MQPAVDVASLTHTYPATRRTAEPRRALNNISLQINQGEIFCLLGPNGSGKSTLFRILSTLINPTDGQATILGFDVSQQQTEVRKCIGVVFQNPSIDKKLTVEENLIHQGHLYNLRGSMLHQRIEKILAQLGLSDQSDDLVEHLSGGMQRRVEIAKGLLHSPQLLLLDEPSTGLDPGARRDLINYLQQLRSSDGVTIVLTTHILEEAEQCDRIAILDLGNIVALDTPLELKSKIGGDVITIKTNQSQDLCEMIQKKFGGSPMIIDNSIHIELQNGHEFLPRLVQTFPGMIDAVTVSKPTLEDVFIQKTGHKFWNNGNITTSSLS